MSAAESAPAMPGQRSMERMRGLLAEHDWNLISDSSAMRPTTVGGRNPKSRHHGRIVAEKDITFGRVRLLISWENGRFTEALIGRDGYARAYVIERVGDVRTIIADPGAGFVFHVEEVRSLA